MSAFPQLRASRKSKTCERIACLSRTAASDGSRRIARYAVQIVALESTMEPGWLNVLKSIKCAKRTKGC